MAIGGSDRRTWRRPDVFHPPTIQATLPLTLAVAVPETSKRTRRVIEETLRTFARAFRATQLYLANNPMRPKAIEDAKAAFRELWLVENSFSVIITEHAFAVDGHVVFEDDDRGASGLPWLLYRDGLRRLELSAGFETQELETVLDVLQRCRAAPSDEDDLVTLLWVANLQYVKFQHVEVIADFDAMCADDESPEDGPDADLAPPQSHLLEAMLPGDGPAPDMIRMVEFESSLGFLDQTEVTYLRKELLRDYEDDGLPKVIETLFEIMEGARSESVQREACNIIDTMVVESLAEGRYVVVAVALREARVVLDRCQHIEASVNADLARLPIRLSEPAVMTQLLDVLDSSESLALAPFLEDLLLELRPRAMPSLLAWYAGATPSPVRQAVERVLVTVGNRHTLEIARLIEHADVNVVQGALLVCRLVASPAFVAPLASQFVAGDRKTRLIVVEALAAIGSPGALQHLERALDDNERDVRVGALRALTSHHYTPMLGKLQRELSGKTLRSTDLSEQMAFFEAFGTVSGDKAVPALNDLLNGKRLFRFNATREMRACAAHALGVVGTTDARAALARAANETDPVVRSAVSRAMRGPT